MSGIEGLGRGEQAGSDFAAISCSGSSGCPCPRTEAHWAALGEEGARELLQRIAALTEERNALQAASDECARQTATDKTEERARIVALGRAYAARKVESAFPTAHLTVFLDAIERGEEP